MAINLLDFVQNVLLVAKQVLGNRAGSPSQAGFPARPTSLHTVSEKKRDTPSLNSLIG